MKIILKDNKLYNAYKQVTCYCVEDILLDVEPIFDKFQYAANCTVFDSTNIINNCYVKLFDFQIIPLTNLGKILYE